MSDSEMNKFYTLKSKYEDSISKEKKKILNSNKSLEEKRDEFKKLRPKCVNCKRPVGTVFKRDYDEQDYTIFLNAHCGDVSNPCNFKMHLNIGYTFLLEDILKKDESDLDEIKNNIIKQKNNLIFGFIDSDKAVDNFENIKEELNGVTLNHEITLEKYISVVDNKIKKKKITNIEKQIFSVISEIKKLVKKYGENNDTVYIQDAVKMQISDLNKLVEERRNLMYSQCFVEHDNGDVKLVEKRVTIQDLEVNLGAS